MDDSEKMLEDSVTTPIGGLGVTSTQKLLNIIFIVDVSGSMAGERIDAVNQAFTNMVPALRKVQQNVKSAFEIKISIMTFDVEAKWIVEPTPILEYVHNEIKADRWATFYSIAFESLQSQLSASAIMAHKGKIAQPYIMFMTDGEPSRNDSYDQKLDILFGNKWFTNSQRYAVLIGEEAVNSQSAKIAVEKFASSSEGVITAVDAQEITAHVQAKTIHTVVNMTKHNPIIDDSGNVNDSGKIDDDPLADTDSSIPDDSDVFPDIDDVFGDDDGSFF